MLAISDTDELAPLRDLLSVMDNSTQSGAFLPENARSEMQACRELDRDSFYDGSTHRKSLEKVLSLDDMLEIYHCTINGKVCLKFISLVFKGLVLLSEDSGFIKCVPLEQ